VTTVPLETLRLPEDDLQDRLGRPHVRKLADSLADEDVGPLYLPLVDEDTLEVLDGGDRVAAHALLGHADIKVRLKKVTGRQRSKILLAGNAHRRHEPQRQRRELKRLYEFYLADEIAREAEGRADAHASAINRRGRPSTPQGRAAARAAAETGLKPNSVTQAMRRRKRMLKRLENVPLYSGELLRHEYHDATYTIDCLGVEPPEELEVQVAILKRRLWQAQLNIANSAAQLKKALDTGFGIREHHAKAWMRDAQELRSRLELLAPAMLCNACHGDGCEECAGRGWLDGMGG
jgi:ParB-like chromosome segregation protein Spo0J